MRVKISGGRGDGTDWPDPGVPFHVDAAEGAQLCGAGLAFPVADEPLTEMPDIQAATDVEVRSVTAAAKPIVNSPKAAWVEYAVTLGADRPEAEAMKKTDLIARYGNS